MIFNLGMFMVRPMHRLMKRYRKAGLALLAIFTVQLVAVSFCAIPSVHATPVTMHKAMDIQCAMDMPIPAGQNIPDCDHCTTPDFSTFANQANDVPAAWTLIAVMPALLHQADLAGQEQTLFAVSDAPPRSTSLIYQKTLRIRL
ncbi:MAG: hypothetical protein Q9M27_06885 [Mariprofundaceae bacterium]|nr:hypothetical protein [Mariprofundaceae bacterium]